MTTNYQIDSSQTKGNSIRIFAPISIGNVSVGFDSLGLAVTPIDGELIGDIVEIKASSNGENQLTCSGRYLHSLPEKQQENIVWQCLLDFNQLFKQQGGKVTAVHLSLEKNTPICSGTGSSACSVVAGLMALNEFYNKPFSENQLLKLMGQLEGKISGGIHYDNVAPCYLGGLQLMHESGDNISLSLPIFDDCYWVMSYPDVVISTRKAREILPKTYSLKDAITFARQLAVFIDASYRQDKAQAFSVLTDVIAEPYRLDLLKDYSQTKQALVEQGCLAVGISGSGPTVFAVCNNLEQAKKAKQILDKQYLQSPQGFTSICKVDTQGSRRI